MLTCPFGVVIVDDELTWGHVRQPVLLQGKVPGDWSGRFRRIDFAGNQIPGMEGGDKWCFTLLRFFHLFLTFLHCRNRALWNWPLWPLLILLKNVTSSSKSRRKKKSLRATAIEVSSTTLSRRRAVMPSLLCLPKQSPDQSETRETVRDKHSRRPLPLPLSSRWTTYDRLRGARR